MNERLKKIIDHPATIPVCVSVVSFGVGFGTGYILGRRNTDVEYEDYDTGDSRDDEPYRGGFGPIIDEMVEVDESIPVDEIVIRSNKQDPIRTEKRIVITQEPSSEAEEVGSAFVASLLEKSKTSDEELENPEEVIVQNVFAGDNDDWNNEVEQRKRSSSEPYVLHKDEFYAEELGYSQITLTYYAGDEIMCDEDDKPVYNHRNVVGPLKFGHGSGDPNVFYVRNDKNRAEYEILQDPGLYSIEVLGLEIEENVRVKSLEHSRPGKFRDD